MGCPSEVEIGDNLTFAIVTHDPDTGALTDVDAVPSYLIYEDSNETAILTGDMDDGSGANSEFDDANTTGFYVKTIACTAVNGFEAGKSYTIYIVATVDGDTGGICYAFKAKAKVGGVSTEEALRRIGAITSGIISGAGTGTETFKDFAESASTIVITVDGSGNRSAITYN